MSVYLSAKVRPNVRQGGDPSLTAQDIRALLLKHVPARNPEIRCNVMYNYVNGIIGIEIEPLQTKERDTIKANCKAEIEALPDFIAWRDG